MAQAQKFGDLKMRISMLGGLQVYEHVGTKAPTWQDLEKACEEVFTWQNNIADLDIIGYGFINVPGAPVAQGARNCNALFFAFRTQDAVNAFLARPIPPLMQGLSIQYRISEIPRLL